MKSRSNGKSFGVDDVLKAMRKGALLRMHLEDGERSYFLSDGRKIREPSARAAIETEGVVGADDGLFGASQTWKWEPLWAH